MERPLPVAHLTGVAVLLLQQCVQARGGEQPALGDVEDQIAIGQREDPLAKPGAVSRSISPAAVTSVGAGNVRTWTINADTASPFDARRDPAR
jgi:hypothetical protein